MLTRYFILLCILHHTLSQRFNQPPPRPSNPAESNDIISQISDVNPDGSFYTKYETANGISYQEQGQLKSLGNQEEAEQVQGSANWITNEGERISISWQADENGAVFQGDHLPTPPPAPEIPVLIQRALDWIAANPSKYDDNEGQYREDNNDNLGARPQTIRPPQPTRAQGLVPRRPPPRRF